MEDIFAARVMTSDLLTVAPETLVEDAAETMLEHDVSSLVVTDDDERLEGILTTTDFVRIVAERKPKDRTPVASYMTSDVETAAAQDPITEVAERMLDHGFHHMPVVDGDDGVVGIVTTTDLTGYLSEVQTASPSS